MDVSQWPQQWAAAADLLLRSRALRWLTPAVRVELLQADGSTSHWDLSHGLAQPADGAAESAVGAIELLPGQVLRRQLRLPRLARADLARAIELEVASATPFPAERTAYGYAVAADPGDDTVGVELALTSRQEIDKRLQQLAPAARDGAPEVWVLPSGHGHGQRAFAPLVFEGYGGAQRRRLTARGQGQRLLLLLLALALLAAVVVTPTAQARLRAIEAQQAFDRINAEAAPQVAQREQLVRQTERLRAVGRLAEQQLALLPVLDMLTRVLPDSAHLSTLRIEGNKVSLNGLADDTAALVQRLGQEPGVGEVRSPSAATRMGANVKESFTLELTLDPKVYGVLSSGAES